MHVNWNDIDLKLLAGLPVEIEGLGKIYSPTVKDVIEIGESKYNEHLSILMFDKSYLDGHFDDDLTDFKLLYSYCYHSEEMRKKVFEAINFFFKLNGYLDFNEHEGDVFFSFDNGGKLNTDNFNAFQEFLCRCNHIKKQNKDDEYNPANSKAAEFIKKLKELKKDTPKKKDSISLHSMINGMAWKPNDHNLDSILNMTIYQLRLGFMAIENIDNYTYTLTGMYTGNIDSKNIKFDQIHWAKILNSK